LDSLQFNALLIAALAEAALLARLIYLGYWKARHYPWFIAMIAFDLAQMAFALQARFIINSIRYWWFWVFSEPVAIGLYAMAAREFANRVRRSYPNLGRLGDELVQWTLIFAVFATTLILLLDISSPTLQWIHQISLLLKRGFLMIIGLSVAGVAYWSRWAPEPVAPNLRRHGWISAAYFIMLSASTFVTKLGLLSYRTAAVLMLWSAALCFCLWIWAFRPGQDEAPPPARIATDEELDNAMQDFHSLANGLGRFVSRLLQR
jgi:hypothetical protein